jgi:hypothetical protein
MIAPTRLALAALALLAATTAAFAQVALPPRPGAPGSEEPPPARIHLGPVGVRPAVIFREVGYDSNVLNRNTTTTPSATRRHRRASTHAAGCMQR